MENYLVIYDSEGYIIQQMSGTVREPKGIPYLWVEIPQRSALIKIDVSTEEHKPIFEEYAKTESMLLEERLIETELEVDFRLSMIELGLI